MSLSLREGAFVGLPLFVFHGCEVGVVKVSSNLLNIGVEEGSFTMELIIEPVSLVGYGSFRVEESSIAIHVVIFPLSIIDAPSLVVKLTISVSPMILNETFVL